MNGPEPHQPPPGRAKIIAVRVVVVAITLCSILLCSWVPVLRVAIMRRRGRDWALFWFVLVLSIVILVCIQGSWTATTANKLGTIGLVTTGIGSIWYYLRYDSRHYRELETRYAVERARAEERQAVLHREAVARNEAALAEAVKASPVFVPGPAPAPPAPRAEDPFADTRSYVRMPQAGPGRQAGPAPAPFQAPPPPPQRVGRHRRPPAPPAPPAPPRTPHRIDEVRAELDELSDLLRKEPKDGARGRREEQEW
ncbi:hypothetical protein FGW37_12955 [Streptomyces rectiverticillatus]|uniref:hypothetical protein n=1 Tax=Streptomyces rectiverticillatus TaxID=173860 RepID=UPI0015C36EDF|nr:hypothetical protein [Streptomyces rectiverticillatus]QLE72387.1 hypothetical protein FGW37_12955 [Streptomyces rectiverticillatus]